MIDFKASSSKQPKTCVKGFSCGLTCISKVNKRSGKPNVCQNDIKSDTGKQAAETLKAGVKGKGKASSKKPKQESEGSIGPDELEKLVPQNAGNSRVFGASKFLNNGDHKNPDRMKEFDIEMHLQHMKSLSDADADKLEKASPGSKPGTIRVPVKGEMVDVDAKKYRRFASEASKDAKKIYDSADDETLDSWADVTKGNAPENSKNPVVAEMSKKLNQRYQALEERRAKARKAAKAASKTKPPVDDDDDDDFSSLFG